MKNRKMWLHENESWMNISDNDVDDLPGFAKKLEEQKVYSVSISFMTYQSMCVQPYLTATPIIATYLSSYKLKTRCVHRIEDKIHS